MSQNIDSISLQNRPFQVTFISPMGTNGVESGKIRNNLSFNILAGYNGGLSGIEIGGVANNLRYDMDGIQISGFSNVVLGKSDGCQLSGFSNVTRKSFKGLQASGFSNVVCEDSKIIQVSGFSNVVKGTTKGTQISGFSNVSTGDATAIQVGGFSNVVKGSIDGTQVSGFCNVSSGAGKAIEVAGFINTTNGSLKGGQFAGFANVATGSVKGVQISGFANTSAKDLQGAQISGFFNYTRKLKGLQLGVINYCDSVESGVPIGVLSFVKHGYRAIDISGDETLYLNASFLTGVKHFYNILSVGSRPGESKLYWGYGYGIGSDQKIGNKFEVSFQLSSHHILVDKWYFDELNLLNKAKVNVLFNLTKNIGIYAGVSYNVFITNETDIEGVFTDSGIVPWSSYSREYSNCLLKMYPGFSVGIRIH